MKKMNPFIFITLLCFALVTIAGCKKYPDGPTLSLRSKKARIANDWQLDKVLINEIDSSAYLPYSAEIGSKISLTKDGNANGTIYEPNGDTLVINDASWQFDDKKEWIGFIYVDPTTSVLDTSIWQIDKLKEKELWLHKKEDKNNNIKQVQFLSQ